jgi:hypothetical protein
VRVQGVRLTGLEAVQADEQACGLEEGAFTHLVGPPCGTLHRFYDARVGHKKRRYRISMGSL